MNKKYLLPAIALLAIIIIGFQIYFDLQIRKTNGAFVAHISVLENFATQEFPTQVQDFNNKQSAPAQK